MALVSLVVLTIAVTGCGFDRAEGRRTAGATASSAADPSTSSTSSTSSSAGTSSDPSASNSGGGTAATTRLLDAGAEPRSRLRYHYTAGDVHAVSLTVEQHLQLTALGDTQDIPGTSITEQIEDRVTRVQTAATATVNRTITAVTVAHPESATATERAAAQQAARQLDGLTFGMVVDDRGRVLSSSPTSHGSLTPALRAMLDQSSGQLAQLSIPMPVSAVGVGAAWQVDQPSVVLGLHLTQHLRCRITAIAGRRVSLTLDVTQDAAPGAFDVPGLPSGAKASVRSWASSGSGTATVDLDRPSAVALDQHTTADVSLSVTVSGRTVPITERVEVTIAQTGT